jgi:serine/threonine-protein kinase
MKKLEIDRDQWPELDRLLDEGLDRPAGERDAWLAALPGEFDALKPQLRDLLSRAAQVETNDFLGALPKIESASGPAAPSTAQAGAIIGPYRLVREIAQGGMGTVWLAERIDGLFSRRVALKLPHGAAAVSGLAERMARERAILATLEHPNIARLYDAGITPDGQPFLALEYVDGRPLGEYAGVPGADGALSLRARLDLFVQIGQAVAYAHERQVIHRDLKPANIYVTEAGEVRLLDFGIARILDHGETHDTHLTQLGGRALTPDYASPEQILGESLTVATDIYSLGVVLYELVSGNRPYRLERHSRAALEHAILQADPARPSETAAAALRGPLRGDLDTIVLKTLKKRPAERYASVRAMVEDVTRHLQGRPVLARPDSRRYRLRKFVTRNRLALAAASTVGLAVLAVAAMWLTLRTGNSAATLHGPPRLGVLPVRNSTGDATLDWTELGLMSMANQQLRAAGLEVVDDAEVVSRVDAAANRNGPAAPWLAETLRRTAGATHLLNAVLQRSGTGYRLHASLTDRRGSIRSWTFDDTDPLSVARRATAAIIINFDPENVGISQDDFVNEAYFRGRALHLQGRCADAQPLLMAAMSQQHAAIEPRIDFASCSRQLGKPEEAEAMLREVLATPGFGADDRRRARALLELGIVLNRTGRVDEADERYAEAEAIATRAGDEDLVARVLVNRGIVEEDRSNFARARAHANRALELFAKAERPVVPGNVYALLANLGIDEGRLDEADHNYRRALESFRAAGDLYDEAMMLNNLGLLRREQGRLDEAEAFHRESAAIRRRIDDRSGLGRVENMLALVYIARGQFDTALQSSESALAIARETGDRFYEAVTLTSRAKALVGLARWQEAVADYDRASRILTELGNRAYVMQIEVERAGIDLELGDLAAARRRAAAVLADARAGAQAVAEVKALEMLGDIASRGADRDAAAQYYRDANGRAEAAGDTGAANQIAIKQAELDLEAGDLAAAAANMARLKDAPPSYPLLRLRAAFAAANGDANAALDFMSRAQAVAGQRWTETDARRLDRYRRAGDG